MNYVISACAVMSCAVVSVACGGSVVGPGSGYGAAPSGTTCASGMVWQGGTSESPQMNPGYACRSCHLGQNFNGQNPSGKRESGRAYFFMGTAYSDYHEANLCAAASPPADAVVEILDTNDAVQLTLPINAVGNFYSNNTQAGVPVPYKARVKANGKTLAMGSSQTVGDCNTCHTDTGLNGAPGRIVWPK